MVEVNRSEMKNVMQLLSEGMDVEMGEITEVVHIDEMIRGGYSEIEKMSREKVDTLVNQWERNWQALFPTLNVQDMEVLN